MQIKRIVLWAVLYLLHFDAMTQAIPAYGKISITSFKDSINPRTTNTTAEIIINEGYTSFEWDNAKFFKMITERRLRIKIIQTNGLQYATIKIPYLSNSHYERISKVAGATYNLVNNKVITTKLDKKNIYEQKINDYTSAISFALPNAQVGSIIEYKYTVTKESFSNIDAWNFQQELPVRTSRFTIAMPEFFKFNTRIAATLPITKKQTNYTQGINVEKNFVRFNTTSFAYTMQHIPAITEDPYISSIKDYTQKIEFQLNEIILPNNEYSYSTSWQELVDDLQQSEAFGALLKKKVKLPVLDTVVTTQQSTLKKLITILTYFKQHYTWDGTYNYLANSLLTTVKEKIGSSADLNFLLLTKLKEYNIECYPLLASTKRNGGIDTTYPSTKQFNTLASLVCIDKKNYIIDASDPVQHYTNIPIALLNTMALKVGKDSCEWIPLVDDSLISKRNIMLTGELDTTSTIRYTAHITTTGYLIDALKNKQTFESNHIKLIKRNTPHTITDYITKIIDNENSSITEEYFVLKRTIQKISNYLAIENIFNFQDEGNPFIAQQRTTDIDFNYKQQYTITSYYSIPSTYLLEHTIKPIRLSIQGGGLQFERKCVNEQNQITTIYTFKINKTTYTPDEYQDVKAFYNAMLFYLNEPLLIKANEVN